MPFLKSFIFVVLAWVGFSVPSPATSPYDSIQLLLSGKAALGWHKNTAENLTASNYSVMNALTILYGTIVNDFDTSLLTVGVQNDQAIDHEWNCTVQGHLVKAKNLVDKLVALGTPPSQLAFKTNIDLLQERFSFTGQADRSTGNYADFIAYYISRSSTYQDTVVGSPGQTNWDLSGDSSTIFYMVNRLIEEFRKITVLLPAEADQAQAADLVQSLIFTGSRGTSKSLVDRILATKPSEALESVDTWKEIVGAPSEAASASGSLCAQWAYWKANNTPPASETISETLGKIETAVQEAGIVHKATEVYELLVPKNADFAKKLDFLTPEIINSGNYSDLSLQEVLVYLLADTNASILSSTNQTSLLNRLSTLCTEVFELVSKHASCCSESAAYATDLVTTLTQWKEAGWPAEHPLLTFFQGSLTNALAEFDSGPDQHSLLALLRKTSNALLAKPLNSPAITEGEFKSPQAACMHLIAQISVAAGLVPDLHLLSQNQFWTELLGSLSDLSALDTQRASFANSLEAWATALSPGGALQNALVASSGWACTEEVQGLAPCKTCNNPPSGDPIQTHLTNLGTALNDALDTYQTTGAAAQLIDWIPLAEQLLWLQHCMESLAKNPLDAASNVAITEALTQWITTGETSLASFTETLQNILGKPENLFFPGFEATVSYPEGATLGVRLDALKAAFSTHFASWTLGADCLTYTSHQPDCTLWEAVLAAIRAISEPLFATPLENIQIVLMGGLERLCANLYIVQVRSTVSQAHQALLQYLDALSAGTASPAAFTQDPYAGLQGILTGLASERSLLPALTTWASVFGELAGGGTSTDSLSDLLLQTIQAFQTLPQRIYQLLDSQPNGEAISPQNVDFLRDFQRFSAQFLQNLDTWTVDSLCGHAEYAEALQTLKNAPLDALRLDIDRALFEVERAQHTCALTAQCEAIQTLAQSFGQQLQALTGPLQSPPANGFDAWLDTTLESFHIALPLPFPATSTSSLDWATSVLETLLTGFGGHSTSHPSLSWEAATEASNALLGWFQTLQTLADWQTLSHTSLSTQFQRLAEAFQQAIDAFVSTPLPDCFFCSRSASAFTDWLLTWRATLITARELSCALADQYALCPSCQALTASVQTLTTSLSRLPLQLHAIAEVAATHHTPNYDQLRAVVHALTPWSVTSLSCTTAATAVDDLCGILEGFHTALSACTSSSPTVAEETPLPPVDACLQLDVATTRLQEHVSAIQKQLGLILQNIHAPPAHQWQSMDFLLSPIKTFLMSIRQALTTVSQCETCPESATLRISAGFSELFDEIFKTVQSIQETWESFADADALRDLYDQLYNFHNILSQLIEQLATQTNATDALTSLGTLQEYFEWADPSTFSQASLPSAFQGLWETAPDVEPSLQSLDALLERFQSLPDQASSAFYVLQRILKQEWPAFSEEVFSALPPLDAAYTALNQFITKIQAPLTKPMTHGTLTIRVAETNSAALWVQAGDVLWETRQQLRHPLCCEGERTLRRGLVDAFQGAQAHVQALLRDLIRQHKPEDEHTVDVLEATSRLARMLQANLSVFRGTEGEWIMLTQTLTNFRETLAGLGLHAPDVWPADEHWPVTEEAAYDLAKVHQGFQTTTTLYEQLQEIWDPSPPQWTEEKQQLFEACEGAFTAMEPTLAQLLEDRLGHGTICLFPQDAIAVQKSQVMQTIREHNRVFAGFLRLLREQQEIQDLAQHRQVAEGLQALTHTLRSIFLHPVATVTLDGRTVSTTNTTQLDALLRTWTDGLHEVQTRLGQSLPDLATALKALAENVLQEHIRLGGVVETTVPSSIPNRPADELARWMLQEIQDEAGLVEGILQWFSRQPFSNYAAFSEALERTRAELSTMARCLRTQLLDAKSPFGELSVQVAKALEPLQTTCMDVLVLLEAPHCDEALTQNTETLRQSVFSVAKALETFTQTLASYSLKLSEATLKNNLNKIQANVSQVVKSFKGVVNAALLAPDTLLCDNAPFVQALDVLGGNDLPPVASQLNSFTRNLLGSVKSVEPLPAFDASLTNPVKIQLALHSMSQTFQTILIPALEALKEFTFAHTDSTCNEQHLTILISIRDGWAEFRTTFQTFFEGPRTTCSSLHEEAELLSLLQEVQNTEKVITEIINSIQQRPLVQTADALDAFLCSVQLHSTALDAVSQYKTDLPSSLVQALVAPLQALKGSFDALDATQDYPNQLTQFYQDLKQSPYHTAYQNALQQITTLLGQTVDPEPTLWKSEGMPSERILKTLTAIAEEITHQASLLEPLVALEAEIGSQTIYQTLTTLSAWLAPKDDDLGTPEGKIFQFFSLVARTSEGIVEKYSPIEGDGPSSTFPEAFQALSKVVGQLVKLFVFEKCSSLAESYRTTLSPLLLDFKRHCLAFLTTPHTQAERTSVLSTLAELDLAAVFREILTYVNVLTTGSAETTYCFSGSVHQFLPQIATHLKTINQTLADLDEEKHLLEFTTEEDCQKLQIARTWLQSALASVATAFQEGTAYTQTMGVQSLIADEEFEHLKAIQKRLCDIRNVFAAMHLQLPGLCSACPTSSIQFLAALEETVESIEASFVRWVDVLKTFCCPKEVGTLWRQITDGVQGFVTTFQTAVKALVHSWSQQPDAFALDPTSFVQPLQALFQTATSLVPLLEDALTTIPHEDGPALTALANQLAPFIQDESVELTPFSASTATLYKERMASLLEELPGLLQMLEDHLVHQVFFKNAELPAFMAEGARILSQLAQAFQSPVPELPLPHQAADSLRFRHRLSKTFEASQSLCIEISKLLQKHTGEEPAKAGLTQSACLMRLAGQVFQLTFEKASNPESAEITERTAAQLYEILMQQRPSQRTQTSAALLLHNIQEAWSAFQEDASIPHLTVLSNFIEAFNSRFFFVIQKAFLQAFPEVESAEEPPLKTPLQTTEVSVSLTQFKEGFNPFLKVLEELLVLLEASDQSDEIAKELVQNNALLSFTLSLGAPLQSHVNRLMKNPSTLYNTEEWALILQGMSTPFEEGIGWQITIQNVLENREREKQLAKQVEDFLALYRLVRVVESLSPSVPWTLLTQQLQTLADHSATLKNLAPEASKAEKLDAIRTVLETSFEVTLDETHWVWPDTSFMTLETLPKEMSQERELLENLMQLLFESWNASKTRVQRRSSSNVQEFLNQLPSHEAEWESTLRLLGTFAQALLKSDCCEPVAATLQRCETSLQGLCQTFGTLEKTRQLPILTETEVEALQNNLSKFSEELSQLQGALQQSPMVDCQSEVFLNRFATVASKLDAVQKAFDVVVEGIFNEPLPSHMVFPLEGGSPCLNTEVLLTRCANHMQALGTSMQKCLILLDSVPGQARPYRKELIESMRTELVPVSKALHETFLVHLNLLHIHEPCEGHNFVLRQNEIARIAQGLSDCALYTKAVTESLEVFKLSELGESVHALRSHLCLTCLLVQQATAMTDANLDRVLIKSIAQSVGALQNTWFLAADQVAQDEEEMARLRSLRQYFLDEAEILQELNGSLQRLNQMAGFSQITVKMPLVTYGMEQIQDDVAEIRQYTAIITNLIEQKFYPTFISKRGEGPVLAGIFEALEMFYRSLEKRQAILKTLDDLSVLLLDSWAPSPQIERLCHHLAFGLKNATCCEDWLALLDELGQAYGSTLQHLDLVVKGDADPVSSLSRDEILANIQTELDCINELLKTVNQAVQACCRNLHGLEVQTCFTEQIPQAFASVRTWIQALNQISTHLITVTQNRAALYDFSEEGSASFSSLSDQFFRLAPFYNRDIETRWQTLNQLLEEQLKESRILENCTQKTILCLFQDSEEEYSSRLEMLQSLQDLISNSLEAVEAYRRACCVRRTKILSRIQSHLTHFSKLKGVLFRNTTFSFAETLLSQLTTTLSSVFENLQKLPSQNPHESERLATLEKMESVLATFHEQLDQYEEKASVSTVIEEPSKQENFYPNAFANLTKVCSKTLKEDLTAWVNVIRNEDGLQDNERCYSPLAGDGATLLGQLHALFTTWTTDEVASLLFCENQDLEQLKEQCQQLADSVEVFQQLFTTLHELLMDPTCCRQRALDLQQIAFQCAKVRNCLDEARQTMTEEALHQQTLDLDSAAECFLEATKFLTPLRMALTPLQVDAEFVCPSSTLHAALQRQVLPMFQKFTTALCSGLEAIHPVGTLTLPIFDTDHGCAAIDEVTTFLVSTIEEIRHALSDEGRRLERLVPFPSHARSLEALREWSLLLPILFERILPFTESIDSRCVLCKDHTHIALQQAFNNLTEPIRELWEILERNQLQWHAQLFHKFVNSVEGFSQRFFQLWSSTSFSPSDDTVFEQVEETLQKMRHPLEAFANRLQSMGTIVPFTSVSATFLMEGTQAFQESQELYERTLQRLGVPFPSLQELDALCLSTDLKADTDRLHVSLQRLAQTFVFRTTNIQMKEFFWNPSWREVQATLRALFQALASMRWDQSPFSEALASNTILCDIQMLLRVQQGYLKALEEWQHCQETFEALNPFYKNLQDLQKIFEIAAPALQRDLTETERQTFHETLDHLNLVAKTLTENLDAYAQTSAFSEEHTCQIATEMLLIQESFQGLQEAVRSLFKSFEPSVALIQSSGFDTAIQSRTVLYRKLSQTVFHFRDAFKAALHNATMSSVRSYNSESVQKLESVAETFKKMNQAVPRSFSLITTCLVSDTTHEQLILSEMVPVLKEMEDAFEAFIDDFRKTCCSQLVYRVFRIAEDLEIFHHGLEAAAQEGAPLTPEAFISQDIAIFADSFNQLIQENKLTDWEQIFVEKSETGNTYLTCQLQKSLPFLDAWLQMLDQMAEGFRDRYKLTFQSEISKPVVYRCSNLQDGLRACATMVLNIRTSLNVLVSKMTNAKFVYSTVYELYFYLGSLSEAMMGLERIPDLLNSMPNVFCQHCVADLSQWITPLLTSVKPAFEDIQKQLEVLRKLFFKYCDYEAAVSMSRINHDFDRILFVFDINRPQVAKFWIDVLSYNSLFLEQIQKTYSLESSPSLNSTVVEIGKIEPSDGLCQMIKIIPLMQSMQRQFLTVVQQLVSTVGYGDQTIVISAFQNPEIGTTNWAMEQRRYHQKVQAFIEKLHPIFNAIYALNYSSTAVISKRVEAISKVLLERASVMTDLYTKWKQNYPCPDWAECSCDGCDVCSHDLPCTECVPCASGCGTCALTEKPLRYELWQSAQVLSSLGTLFHEFSVGIFNDCCLEPYTVFFGMLKPLSDLNAYLTAFLESAPLSTEGCPQKLKDLFVSGFSALDQALINFIAGCQTARNTPSKKCRMPLLTNAFKVLYEIFQPYELKDEESFTPTILSRCHEILTQYSIQEPTLETIEKFENICKEVEFVFQIFSSFIKNMSMTTYSIALKISLVLEDKSVFQEFMFQAYDQLEDLSLHFDELLITDVPLCPTCPTKDLNKFIKDCANTFRTMAKEFLNLRASVSGSTCCLPLEEMLTETASLLQAFALDTKVIFEHTVLSREWLYGEHSGNLRQLNQTLSAITQDLVRIVSVRQQIPMPTLFKTCFAEMLAEEWAPLNQHLKSDVCSVLTCWLQNLGVDFSNLALAQVPEQPLKIVESISLMTNVLQGVCTMIQDVEAAFLQQALDSTPHPDCMAAVQELVQVFEILMEGMDQLERSVSTTYYCIHQNPIKEIAEVSTLMRQVHEALGHLFLELEAFKDLDLVHALRRLCSQIHRLRSLLPKLAMLNNFEATLNDEKGEVASFGNLVQHHVEALSALHKILEPLQTDILSRSCLVEKLDQATNAVDEILQSVRTFLLETLGKPVALPEDLDFTGCGITLSRNTSQALTQFEEDLELIADSWQMLADLCAQYQIVSKDVHTLSALDAKVQTVQMLQDDLSAVVRTLESLITEDGSSFERTPPSLQRVEDSLQNLRQVLTAQPLEQQRISILQKWAQFVAQCTAIMQQIETVQQVNEVTKISSAVLSVFETMMPLTPWLRDLEQRIQDAPLTLAGRVHCYKQADAKAPFVDLLTSFQELAKACKAPSVPTVVIHLKGHLNQQFHEMSNIIDDFAEEFLSLAEHLTMMNIATPMLLDTEALCRVAFDSNSVTALFANIDSSLETEDCSSGLQTLGSSLELWETEMRNAVRILIDRQEDVRLSLLLTQTDMYSLTTAGHAVIDDLFDPVYQANGRPLVNSQGGVQLFDTSLLNQVAATMRDAQAFHNQMFRSP